MLNKLITILVLAVAGIVGLSYVANSIPNFSLGDFKGSTVNNVDVTKMQAAFTSSQGLSAGEVSLEQIDVVQKQKMWSFAGPGIAGSCSTLKDGKAKITYHADTLRTPPVITKDLTGVITITLPDPTIRSVGITEFDSKAIHNSESCGLLLKKFPDIQAMNRSVQKTACDWGRDNASQRLSQRADVEKTLNDLAMGLGVTAPMSIKWQNVPMTLPKECEGLDK